MDVKKNRAELIEALRSGKYEQGRMSLKVTNDLNQTLYCPLGIACEIYHKHNPDNSGWLDNYYHDSQLRAFSIDKGVCGSISATSPPSEVAEFFGFSGYDVGTIMVNNDTHHKDFDFVADLIESLPIYKGVENGERV